VSGEIVVGDAEAEQAILEMINQERSNLGLSPLTMDEGLRAAARDRSRDMLDRGYLSHYDPVTGAPLTNTYEVIARSGNAMRAAEWWWTSQDHYTILTRADLRRIGIGVASSSRVIVTAQLSP
jgi:uncharacterized protein YkwD